MGKLAISVGEAADACSLSKSLIYNLIRADLFPHVHWGAKRVTVPIAELERFLHEQADGKAEEVKQP